jgi:hypothetical protein
MPRIPNSPVTCPLNIDETAEAYVMNRLSARDALQFAIHCLTCRHCAVASDEAAWFVGAMKAAARRLSAEPRIPPLQRSQMTVTGSTPMPFGGRCVRMRFQFGLTKG